MVSPGVLTLPLSIAPMIDWTYTHFRVLMRILAPNALLYTEMQTTGAILHNPNRALAYDGIEHPIAIQLGGSEPHILATCAKMAEQQGFDEINLNLGCPSDRVQAGHFGACLMKEPLLVVRCIEEIKKAVAIPVSAKTRIGIDNQDSYQFFKTFAKQLIDAGCDKLIVHARKAWLNGLSPKQNRTLPPIHYDYVYQLKEEFPHIPIHINGNINEVYAISDHLSRVDGVMLGRLACSNPYMIAEIHHTLYPNLNKPNRTQSFKAYIDYLFTQERAGASLSLLLKPLFNLAYSLPGAGLWKKQLMAVLHTKKVQQLNDLVYLLSNIEAIPKERI